MSKQIFSEYLNECGFYFANITNPDKTLFGADVKNDKKKKKSKKDKQDKLEANPLHNEKFANYLQVVNSVQ